MAQVKPTILVTGKAGYIGSRVALAWNRARYGIIVLDNWAYGHRELVENSLKVESYQFHFLIHNDITATFALCVDCSIILLLD